MLILENLWLWEANTIIARYIYLSIYSHIHSVFCLTTDPYPLPKRVQSSSCSHNFRYSLSSPSSCLLLLPCLTTRMFRSITFCLRQFLRKMWPIQSVPLLLIVCMSSLSPWLFVALPHFSHDRFNWSTPSVSCSRFQNCQGISDLLA